MRFLSFCLIVGSLWIMGCEEVNPNFQAEANDASFFHRSMKQLTDVIVHDIFSPPVASRIYAYPSIAAYEVAIHGDSSYQSLVGQLNGLTELPQPEAGVEYCYPLASVYAFLTVGQKYIFSEDTIKLFRDKINEEFKALKIPAAVYDRSIAYGGAVAKAIIDWAGKDNYNQTRTYPKFAILDEPARWQPTPPDYMDGIEPHWREIRPFVLDSAMQFTPPPPTPFDMDKNSQFYKEMMEVYSALDEDKDNRLEIAKFWDCNPYVSHHTGHVMFATKKITPGGHWIGIAKIACEKQGSNFMETVSAYTLTSIALADAFISCWDEKYRSNLIRPETVINLHVDQDWLPALQTPPFPEYTSGHSVISRAAAMALTSIFGENFSFVDDTEAEYGLTVRSFNSFKNASEEAAVSRLYGGIHYRPAIDNGVAQGERVGRFVVAQVKMKK